MHFSRRYFAVRKVDLLLSRTPAPVMSRTRFRGRFVLWLGLCFAAAWQSGAAAEISRSQERMVEWTFHSSKRYSDPFNDVSVDVVFSAGGRAWRVPTFWRGGQDWTVRFAPPAPGEYSYEIQSTDPSNPSLNGRKGRVTVLPYRGANELFEHGMLRVSKNGRYFEHADGKPFYWLGDTWWTGLSDRLSWEGFQQLTSDRKRKGFTVVQTVVGLVPIEEVAPLDPGFHNEGGAVWDAGFARINPRYFDYADRRIQNILDAGMVPALFGAWANVLDEMGVEKMKKHWRYIIARYGAYPAFWIAGGEVADPSPEVANRWTAANRPKTPGGWTDVVRYIRATDPYHHPLSVHELYFPSLAFPVQDETLTDFDCIQPSHFGWPSIATAVVQLNMHYARTTVRKPIVQCEIGYEGLGSYHLQDFQRVAFWLTMLNGAAGHTYGAVGTWESYTSDKPFHRIRWSLTTWDEGMVLPGSYQVGIGAKLLREYPWWRFEPHPEWVAPRGVTMLTPRTDVNGFGTDVDYGKLSEPNGKSTADSGSIFASYAAGIPGEVRFVYTPSMGFAPLTTALPTVLGLELGVRYHAWFWDPTNGTKIDLGSVERPSPGALIHTSGFQPESAECVSPGKIVLAPADITEVDVSASVEIDRNAEGGILLRYRDESNYVVALYSEKDNSISLTERIKGVDSPALGRVNLPPRALMSVRLMTEVRANAAVVSLMDGEHRYSGPIVDIQTMAGGAVGLLCHSMNITRPFHNFELRRSSTLVTDERLETMLYDAAGRFRGEIGGPARPSSEASGLANWGELAERKNILLDAFRPVRIPYPGDWVLVLRSVKSTQPDRWRPSSPTKPGVN